MNPNSLDTLFLKLLCHNYYLISKVGVRFFKLICIYFISNDFNELKKYTINYIALKLISPLREMISYLSAPTRIEQLDALRLLFLKSSQLMFQTVVLQTAIILRHIDNH